MDVVLPHSKPVINAVSHMKTLSLSFPESLTVRWSQKDEKEEKEVEAWYCHQRNRPQPSTDSNRAMALPHMADADVSVFLGSSLRSQF